MDLGKLGSALVSAIIPKPIMDQAMTTLQSVAQGAQTVQSAFEGLNKAATDFTSKLANLPGLSDLASRLMGPGAGALSGLAQQGMGSFEKLLTDSIGQLSQRTLENGQSVTPNTLGNRALAGELGRILDILKGLPSQQQPTQQGFDAQYKSAVENLDKNFSLLDTAAGRGGKDGLIGKADLQAALNNPALPQDLKNSLQFLLSNPAAMNQLDVASGSGNVDGLISRGDVGAALKGINSSGTPAQGGTGAITPEQHKLLHQIKNPALRHALAQIFQQMNAQGQSGTAGGANGNTGAVGNTGGTNNTPATGNDLMNQLLNVLKQFATSANGGTGTGATNTAATGTDFQSQLQSLLQQLQQAGLVPPGTAAATSGATSATPAASTPVATTPFATTPTTPTTTAATSVGGGSMMDIVNQGLAGANGQVTQQEQSMLDKIQDPNQKAMMKAQMELQHAQEILSYISNIMKKMNEMAMAVINNFK